MDHRDNQGIVPAAQDMEACQGRQRAEGPGSLLKASHALPNGPFLKPPDPFMSLHKSTIGRPVGILSLIESFFVSCFSLVPNLCNPAASLPPKISPHLVPTAHFPLSRPPLRQASLALSSLPHRQRARWSELLVFRLPAWMVTKVMESIQSNRPHSGYEQNKTKKTLLLVI